MKVENSKKEVANVENAKVFFPKKSTENCLIYNRKNENENPTKKIKIEKRPKIEIWMKNKKIIQ